jgi:hypothetical protein
MGKHDVRRALVAMEEDDGVRERLAAGDFGAVDGLDLSAEEQTLVQDAAGDMPEVSGFGIASYLKFDGVDGEYTHKDHKGQIGMVDLGQSAFKWQTAVKYTYKY